MLGLQILKRLIVGELFLGLLIVRQLFLIAGHLILQLFNFLLIGGRAGKEQTDLSKTAT